MKTYNYERTKAVEYAKFWAYKRNPEYYNFDLLGGDCTNFISQCVFAGSNQMNFTNLTGWYYINLNDRSASWSSVEYFYKFIMNNKNLGPFAREVPNSQLEIGDVIQLGRTTGEFYHSLIISKIENDNIYVCAHTRDALDKPLNSFYYERSRFIHILGVKK